MISSREFAELLAAERINPRGEARADLRNAVLCSLYANGKRDPRKRPTPFSPADFMPQFDEGAGPEPEERRQTPEEQIAVMRQVALVLGGGGKG